MTIKDLIPLINPTTDQGDIVIRLRVGEHVVINFNAQELDQLLTLPSVVGLIITRITIYDGSLLLDVTDSDFSY